MFIVSAKLIMFNTISVNLVKYPTIVHIISNCLRTQAILTSMSGLWRRQETVHFDFLELRYEMVAMYYVKEITCWIMKKSMKNVTRYKMLQFKSLCHVRCSIYGAMQSSTRQPMPVTIRIEQMVLPCLGMSLKRFSKRLFKISSAQPVTTQAVITQRGSLNVEKLTNNKNEDSLWKNNGN